MGTVRRSGMWKYRRRDISFREDMDSNVVLILDKLEGQGCGWWQRSLYAW